LAIHFRKSRKKNAVKAALLEAVRELEETPRIVMGKAVLNLIPMNSPHKGHALQELLLATGASQALYVGDDDTDEDIFSLNDERILTVRIGKKKQSQARYFLERQSEISILLRKILKFQTAR
jgi:trehalose 6-phosphate phosphatase